MRRRLIAVALSACCVALGDAGPVAAAAMAGPRAVALAEVYRADIDPSAYWVSEKLDGVRAVWDGRELRFRSGRRVPAPDWFIAGLPPQALDGELWIGRGRFDELSGIVRTAQPVDADWRRVKYMVFDLPEAAGAFSQRIERLNDVVTAQASRWLLPLAQFRVADRAALMATLDEVVGVGGEGLVLHRADAPYRTGRSADLLKLKPLLDAEATVVGYEPGKGRYSGMLGALRVKTADGRVFRLGSGFTDAQRRDPPALGRTVSYRFQELTRGRMPRFARFWRLYEDF